MPAVDLDIAPAPAFGGVYANSLMGEAASPLPAGVAVAPVGVPWEGERIMCASATKAGAPCSNVATVGPHCAGHHRAVLAAPVVEDAEPALPAEPPAVIRPITDERGFMVLLDVLGIGG